MGEFDLVQTFFEKLIKTEIEPLILEWTQKFSCCLDQNDVTEQVEDLLTVGGVSWRKLELVKWRYDLDKEISEKEEKENIH